MNVFTWPRFEKEAKNSEKGYLRCLLRGLAFKWK